MCLRCAEICILCEILTQFINCPLPIFRRYFTNENDMSAGNATLPGTVEDYVGRALLFHNDKNGEFNVDNGLDACGIFELVNSDVDVKKGDVAATAADGTATATATATSSSTSLEAVLPFVAAFAGIFFTGGMFL